MEIRVLGSLEVVDDEGRNLELPGGRPRVLLLLLCADANRVVTADRLIESLWLGAPPQSAVKIVHRYVSLLRSHGLGERLETRASGYTLRLEEGELDVDRAVAAGAAARASEPRRAAGLLRDALALWRGQPYAEAAAEGLANTEIRRLEDLRLRLLEQRIDADLELGHHREVVGELEQLVHEHPLLERFRAQLMLSLYRSGRQAEALQAYRDARHMLVEELGLEPSHELKELERRILAQESDLDATRPPKPSTPRTRKRLLAFLPILAAAAGAAFGISIATENGEAPAIAANTVIRLDGSTGRRAQVVPVGSTPRVLALADGALFVSNFGDSTVTRIPLDKGQPTTVGTETPPTALAVGAGSVWVLSAYDGLLTRLDAANGQKLATIPLEKNNSGIAVGAGAVWLTNTDAGTLTRIDTATLGRIAVRTDLNGPVGVAVGAGSVWVAESFPKRLLRLDPRTGRTEEAIPLQLTPGELAFGAGALWATDPADEEVTRIDDRTQAERLIPVGADPIAIAVGGPDAWVVNDLDHSLTELDAKTGSALRTVVLTKGNPHPTPRNQHPRMLTPGGVAVDAYGNAWTSIQNF